jgi:hypothetical protein
VAFTDESSYVGGSTVTVTLGGPEDSGWARALLYDENGFEVARVTGPSNTGDDGTTRPTMQYPFTLRGKAPLKPGTYTWQATTWGSPYDTIGTPAFPHTEAVRVETNQFTVLPGGPTPRPDVAAIKIVGVSPRVRDASPTDAYNSRASGLDVVGINTYVYLTPQSTTTTIATNYTWSVIREPIPGAAVVDYDTSSVFKFHPTAGGEYFVRLIPQLITGTAPVRVQRIYAARYTGTGTEGSNIPVIPMCGFSACHGAGSTGPRNKLAKWEGTAHAHMLESFLNGERGSSYRTSCLECHTLGYDTRATGNGNFYEVAQNLAFNLNQIPTWVKDAATTGPHHWNDLPAALQLKSNIQCEACHGPGSDHSGDVTKISGPRYDSESCRQCHDAPTHHMHVAEYDSSGHARTNLAGGGSVQSSTSCQKCHTAEGFVNIAVRGLAAIPAGITTRNPVGCVACHDPHDNTYDPQLRTTAPVTLPIGAIYNGGRGNICANCHNSRISNPASTVATSSRGAHHGPQADILLGKSAYDWSAPYPVAASIHATTVTDTCVHCHMATPPTNGATPTAGEHTFKIVSDTGISNVTNACGGCHIGLTTIDRVPPIPVDYNGDGFTSGVQTEVSGVLAILRTQILARLAGTSWNPAEERISISSSAWSALTLNKKAVLYNFNLCSEDKSEGIHNARYVVAILQRSYYYLTGHLFSVDYPLATIVDTVPPSAPLDGPDGVVTGIQRRIWRQYE